MSMYDGLGLDEEQTRRLRDLVELEPTANMQKRLEQEQARYAAIESWEYGKLQSALGAIKYQQGRLAEALDRDAIQATRPESCTCLGVGGRRPGWVSVGEQTWHYLDWHCSCPEGHARLVFDREQLAAYKKAQALEREVLFRESLPARFQDFTIDSWKARTVEQLAVQEQLRAWFEDDAYEDAEGDLVDMPQSLVLHGPYGTGKTGLAGAIGARLLADRVVCEVHMTAVPRLLDRVRATFNRRERGDERESDVMDELFDVECLILDDVGAERSTDWVVERLFTLINHRHDAELRTIITSNLDPIGLAEHLGERTWWRIHEMSFEVDLNGCPNLRAVKPKRPAKPKTAEPARRENVVDLKRRAG